MIEIPLTKGYVAIIDDEDAHLAALRWHAHVMPGKAVYARRTAHADGTKKNVMLHRVIMNAAPGEPVDHRDGDGLNCRRGNLRIVTASENCMNRRGPRSDNRFSPYLGVYYSERMDRYLAKIGRTHLGTFKTPEEANEARLAAEIKLWGVQPRRAHAHS